MRGDYLSYLLQDFWFQVPTCFVAHFVAVAPGMVWRHVVRSILFVINLVKLKAEPILRLGEIWNGSFS